MSDCSLYPAGQCTRYVCEHYTGTIGPVWGDAWQWLSSAAAAGIASSPEPSLGAIAVWGPNVGGASALGHVALVTGLAPLEVTGQDWPIGAGPTTWAIGAAGAPGAPTGYIPAPPQEDSPMTDAERADLAGALVDLAYAADLRRGADDPGRAYWLAQFSKPGNLTVAMDSFLATPEAEAAEAKPVS